MDFRIKSDYGFPTRSEETWTTKELVEFACEIPADTNQGQLEVIEAKVTKLQELVVALIEQLPQGQPEDFVRKHLLSYGMELK